MKVVISFILALALVSTATPPTCAAPRQVLQGTEIHLTLLTPISSSHSREGDPFVAVLAQPVALDSLILLPTGTRVNGVIGTIQKAKAFSIFRGNAYMNLTFKNVEVDSRLIPIQMSILAIGEPRVDSYSKPRKDMKITEGEVVEEKHDYKGRRSGRGSWRRWRFGSRGDFQQRDARTRHWLRGGCSLCCGAQGQRDRSAGEQRDVDADGQHGQCAGGGG
jgi:hypothetical protein